LNAQNRIMLIMIFCCVHRRCS